MEPSLLIAEDDAPLRDVLVRSLRAEGFAVRAVGSGRELLDQAATARPAKAIARVELIGTAWPHGAIVQDNTLDVYVARIRRKLRTLPEAPAIKTVHGVGYRLQ